MRCPSSVQDHVQVNFRKGCWLFALKSFEEAGCNSESSTLTLGPAEAKHINTCGLSSILQIIFETLQNAWDLITGFNSWFW